MDKTNPQYNLAKRKLKRKKGDPPGDTWVAHMVERDPVDNKRPKLSDLGEELLVGKRWRWEYFKRGPVPDGHAMEDA